MLRDVVGPKGLKSCRSYVQNDLRPFNAARRQAFEELRGEVQPRRRRGHATGFAREHGLVPFTVERSVSASDVGWQRDMAVDLDRLEAVAVRTENADASPAVRGQRVRCDLQRNARRDRKNLSDA